MIRNLVTLVAVVSITAAFAGGAQAASKAIDLVERSKISVESMTRDENIGKYLRKNLKEAKGVLVIPQMLKGALFIGGEAGSGVLLVRGDDGTYSNPAFFTLGALSIGFQIGGSASEVMLLLMTDKGVNAIVGNKRIKLGADMGIAAGPIGAGVEAGVTLGSTDVLAYSVSKGVYLGISLEGAVIEPRETLNKEYYGKKVSSKEIVSGRRYSNSHANGLRAALAAARN